MTLVAKLSECQEGWLLLILSGMNGGQNSGKAEALYNSSTVVSATKVSSLLCFS